MMIIIIGKARTLRRSKTTIKALTETALSGHHSKTYGHQFYLSCHCRCSTFKANIQCQRLVVLCSCVGLGLLCVAFYNVTVAWLSMYWLYGVGGRNSRGIRQ